MNSLNKNTIKILVVGSGPSGIATATKLIEYGFNNIQILEAENRIGGRIHTIEFGENVLDLGAQWCHGEKNNVVYELATNHQKDIFESTQNVYRNFNCVKSNKEIVPSEICHKLGKIIKDCTESKESENEIVKFNGSLGEFIDRKFNNILQKPENSDIDKTTAIQFLDFYKKFECSLEAADTIYDISAKGYDTYWECEGDQLLNWKGKGYIKILKILMKSTDEKPLGILEDKILLNRKVEKINWMPNSEEKIFVKCKNNNELIEANHVICTVSLGVLKEQHNKLFSPMLSQQKINAINGLSFGNVDKLYIEFPKPFWPKDWSGVCLLWEDNDLNELRSNKKLSWLEGVFGFYIVDDQPNILCGWIVGENGRLMEQDTDENVLNGCIYLLKKFLTFDITQPKCLKRTTWYLNENFRGSYSFHSMQTEKLNVNNIDLAEPLISDDMPRVQFAGEATHDHYYSTVHGAVESGWREASRLNEFYNKKNIKSQL